ncbi:MAG TPA: DUF433 domain-containing protein [Thermoanaerobaculia bacterium]|jgi:hypothetical protein
MKELNRITLDPDVMGGKPCIRGMRSGGWTDPKDPNPKGVKYRSPG